MGGFNLIAMEISQVPGSPVPVGMCLPVGSESPLPQGCHAADLVENNKG